MKSLLFYFFLVAVFFFENSNEQTTDTNQYTAVTTEKSTTTTTPWWTRTLPIIVTRTVVPRPRPPVQGTTSPNRVSEAVSIAIPVVLFALTIFIGFGLIIYAIRTGGNGRFFLTRTNEPSIP